MNVLECIGVTVNDRIGYVMVDEQAALAASPIACRLADLNERYIKEATAGDPNSQITLMTLLVTVAQIELATRNSPLRKVKP